MLRAEGQWGDRATERREIPVASKGSTRTSGVPVKRRQESWPSGLVSLPRLRRVGFCFWDPLYLGPPPCSQQKPYVRDDIQKTDHVIWRLSAAAQNSVAFRVIYRVKVVLRPSTQGTTVAAGSCDPGASLLPLGNEVCTVTTGQ